MAVIDEEDEDEGEDMRMVMSEKGMREFVRCQRELVALATAHRQDLISKEAFLKVNVNFSPRTIDGHTQLVSPSDSHPCCAGFSIVRRVATFPEGPGCAGTSEHR